MEKNRDSLFSKNRAALNRTMTQSTGLNQQYNKFNRRTCQLEWSSPSPGLNPTEILWHDLKRAIHTRCTRILLERFYKEEWFKSDPQLQKTFG